MPKLGYKQTQKHISGKMKNNSGLFKKGSKTKTQFKKGYKSIYIGSKNGNWKGGFSQRDYLRKLRLSVIEILGNKCCKCGFSDRRALQIDHINGGGSKERKEKGFNGNFHRHVLKSFMNKENKYQLLCANCNWIKRCEENETKHNLKECI